MVCKTWKNTLNYLSAELEYQRHHKISPGQYAASFAVGTLISFLPIPVIDTLLASFVLMRGKQINKLAFLGARLVWNDFIVYPLYVPSFKFGASILRLNNWFPSGFFPDTDKLFWLLSFFLGVLFVALLATISSYGLVMTVLTILKPMWRRFGDR